MRCSRRAAAAPTCRWAITSRIANAELLRTRYLEATARSLYQRPAIWATTLHHCLPAASATTSLCGHSPTSSIFSNWSCMAAAKSARDRLPAMMRPKQSDTASEAARRSSIGIWVKKSAVRLRTSETKRSGGISRTGPATDRRRARSLSAIARSRVMIHAPPTRPESSWTY